MNHPFHLKITKQTRTLFVFIVIIMAGWLLLLCGATVFVYAQVKDLNNSLELSRTQMNDLAFSDARTSLAQAQSSLNSVRRIFPVFATISWLPIAGDRVDAFGVLVRTSEDLLEALDGLSQLGEEVIRLTGLTQEYLLSMKQGLVPEITFGDLTTETKRAILKRVSSAAPDMELFVSQIKLINEEFDYLKHDTLIAPFLAVLEPSRIELEKHSQQLQQAAVMARLLPAFAGLEQEQTTLLLFLNNNELRPAGGFIGSYGVLSTNGGDIFTLETADVYNLDNAVSAQVMRQAPAPLQKYNEATKWFFRDSNWSPDFEVAAQQSATQFLEEVAFLQDPHTIPTTDRVDNVIGFTPTYASELLKITGPITIGSQTFTSENVADALEYQVQYGYAKTGLPVAQRKEILADLVTEMKNKIYALPSDAWPRVSEVTQNALTQKQLLLFSVQAPVQEVITRAGWGGKIVSQAADTLLIADANLASLKSDDAVERSIQYGIQKNSAGDWIGTVSILYAHAGNFDLKTTRYRTYTRLYVPSGSRLVRSEGMLKNDALRNPSGEEGSVDVFEELGMTAFGAFTSVEPGAQQTLTFQFELSPQVISAIEAGEYELQVFKQAGARNHALTLNLDFDAPVTNATIPEDKTQWGDNVYRLNTILDQDKEIKIEVRK